MAQEDGNGISLSHREMVRTLGAIRRWDDRRNFLRNFTYDENLGYWVQPSVQPLTRPQEIIGAPECRKVHYGCNQKLKNGWLNIDIKYFEAEGYRRVNIIEKHPFNDGTVLFGYSEDMIEHLTQAEGIFFISEVYRSLAPGGVLRLSFPGLEGVLKKHYSPAIEKRMREGELEAYTIWDHVNFFSKEDIKLVATHLGFRSVKFFEYGQSDHPELANLETRDHQIGLNTNVELVK